MTKSTGIMMTDESVRAILAGTKTQTRRVVNTRHPLSYIGPLGEEHNPSNWGWFFDGPDHNGYMVLGRGHNDRQNHGSISIRSPYGEVGDRLYVKEAWQAWRQTNVEYDEWEAITATVRSGSSWGDYINDRGHPNVIEYRATSKSTGPWSTSMFMPRWASRITLEVSEVRVQRLQEISEDDARAEVEFGTMQDAIINGEPGRVAFFNARDAYAYRWNAINGKRRRREPRELGDPGVGLYRTVVDEDATWKSNPWIWALTFRRVTP